MNAWSLLALATAAACTAFAAAYLLARRINNYGIVDVVWSYAFAFLAGFYALAGTGWPMRRALIAAMVSVWSLRLGTHLLIRVASHHPTEDTRYVQLRQDWAGHFGPKMFGFFQLQAGSVILLGVAFLFPAQNSMAQWHGLEIAGAGLWLLAISGEALADAQLAAFKRDPANRGQVCDHGLWRYSRHPNYFFEWLIWVAFAMFSASSPGGLWGIVSPVLMLYFVLRVTGIPATEAQAIRTRGDEYRRYQQTTSAFVPWFPRSA